MKGGLVTYDGGEQVGITSAAQQPPAPTGTPALPDGGNNGQQGQGPGVESRVDVGTTPPGSGALEWYGKLLNGDFDSLSENQGEAVGTITFGVTIVLIGAITERYILD